MNFGVKKLDIDFWILAGVGFGLLIVVHSRRNCITIGYLVLIQQIEMLLGGVTRRRDWRKLYYVIHPSPSPNI